MKEASFRVDRPLFPSGSPILSLDYFPMLNSALFTTTRNENIAIELPSVSDSAPLRNRSVVYLDQKDWSSLAKLRHEPKSVSPPAERDAAKEIIELAKRNKIILPMSAGHLSETCKWTNDRRRYNLALTILQFSRGWQMCDPLTVRRSELRGSLLTSRNADPSPLPVFTLAPDALHAGRSREITTAEIGIEGERERLALNALTSITATIDILLDVNPIEVAPTPGWVQKFQEFTNWLSTQSLISDQKRKRIEISVLSDTSIEVAKEAHAIGLTSDEMRIWLEKRARSEIRSMPTLGLFTEVLQQKHLNPGTNWMPNDLVDLMYLTCAAAYADYVVGDNSQISQVEQALKRLGRPRNVYRNLRDLVTALESDKV